MASRDIKDLDPALQPLAEQFIAVCNAHPVFQAMGATVFLTQTYRSSMEQNNDYAQGRTEPGHIITDARGGQSAHNCCDALGNPDARAFDFGVKKPDGTCDWNPQDDLWQRAISIGKSLGLVSGSDFHSIKDYPHFQLAGWESPSPHPIVSPVPPAWASSPQIVGEG